MYLLLSDVSNVIFSLVVDNLDFVTFTDDLRDLFKSHVTALVSVIKFAVLVTLNDSYIAHTNFPYCNVDSYRTL